MPAPGPRRSPRPRPVRPRASTAHPPRAPWDPALKGERSAPPGRAAGRRAPAAVLRLPAPVRPALDRWGERRLSEAGGKRDQGRCWRAGAPAIPPALWALCRLALVGTPKDDGRAVAGSILRRGVVERPPRGGRRRSDTHAALVPRPARTPESRRPVVSRRAAPAAGGGSGRLRQAAWLQAVLPAARSESSARYQLRWPPSGPRSSAPDRPCCRGSRRARRWRCCTTRRR